MKHQYLRAMGIDVWVPRNSTGTSSEVDTAAPAAAPRAGEQPHINLYLIAYPGLGVVFEDPGDDGFPGCKRLSDDVALAVLGRSSTGKMSRFQWPGEDQANDSTGDPAEAVRNQVKRLPPRVVAFGTLAGKCLAIPDNDVVRQGKQSIMGAPGLMELMAEPQAKRVLWGALTGFRE